MLSQATKDALKVLNIDPEKLIEAVKAEKEIPVEIPAGQFFTNEELSKRDAQTEKTNYEKGKTAGTEMLIDDIKKSEGLTFEGKKKDKLINALKEKYEAEKGKDTDQKVKDRDKQIEELTKSLAEKESAFETVKKQSETLQRDFEFTQILPDNRNQVLSTQEWLFRLRSNGLELDNVDGKKVLRQNGEIVLDPKTKTPLVPSEAVKQIFESKKDWLVQKQKVGGSGGTGGGDNFGKDGNGIYSKKSEFDKAMEDKGIRFTSNQYQAELNAAVKANPDMVMAE